MLCHHHPLPLSYVHTYNNNVLSRQGTLVVVVVLVAGVYSLLNYDDDDDEEIAQ